MSGSSNNFDYIFVRLSENSKPDKFLEIGKQVSNGEVVFSHYAIDGNLGYYYYKKT